MAKLITQSAYARHRKCNLKTVCDAINQGHIIAKKVGQNVMIDPEKADKDWEANRSTQVTSGKGTDDYSKARALREKANAEKAILQVAEYKKTLIKKEDVIKKVSAIGFGVKERLRGLPQKLAAELAAESDAHTLELFLQSEIDQALSGLDELKKGF